MMLAPRITGLLLLMWSALVYGGDILMVRSSQGFPETMLALQQAIREHGYTLSRVQRVDIGLSNSGYQTDKYRVVFFGKPDEIRELSLHHPQFIPYMPLKVAIFAEGEDTLITAVNPTRFSVMSTDAWVKTLLSRWAGDLALILDAVRGQP